ncbi:MAG TPA: DUF4160 domain-containing protein [Mesorhizobium sp.]
MPTVLRLADVRVVIYPNDHRPAHVHVKGPAGEAVFVLNCPEGPPELREAFGFKRSDLNRLKEELSEVLAVLCADWRAIHGNH